MPTIQIGGKHIELSEIETNEYGPIVNSVGWEHVKIHQGKMFYASYLGTALADGGTAQVWFAVGSQTAHVLIEGKAGGKAWGYLIEGGTVSGGTAITAYNQNRESAAVPESALKHTPTVGGGGVTLLSEYIPGGGATPVSASAGQARTNSEWLLAANTDYVVRIINASGGAQPVQISLQWYEG